MQGSPVGRTAAAVLVALGALALTGCASAPAGGDGFVGNPWDFEPGAPSVVVVEEEESSGPGILDIFLAILLSDDDDDDAFFEVADHGGRDRGRHHGHRGSGKKCPGGGKRGRK